MSNKVSASETTYRNTKIPDSGAEIPQSIKQAHKDDSFKLFECIQALMKGRLPTNEQLDRFLNMSKTNTAIDSRAHMLSKDGQEFYKDFQQLIQNTREVIAEKNQQELFQNFIYHCNRASDTVPETVDAQGPANAAKNVVSRNEAEKEGREVLDNLKAVASVLTTNSEFRSIINELFQLAMEVFSDGARKVAEGAQGMADEISQGATQLSDATANAANSGPSGQRDYDQRLQRGNQGVDDGTSRVYGNTQDYPYDKDYENRQGTATRGYPNDTAYGTRQDLGRSTNDYSLDNSLDNSYGTRQDLGRSTNDYSLDTSYGGRQDGVGSSMDYPNNSSYGTRQNHQQENYSVKDDAKAHGANLKQEISQQFSNRFGNIKERAQGKKTQLRENASDYVGQKMPKERRQEFIERLKLVMTQVQSDPQYQSAIDSIMNLMGNWRQRSQGPGQAATQEIKKATNDPNVEMAIVEFKTILERWAQGYSLDPIISLVQDLWRRAKEDPDMSQYMDNVSIYLTKAIRDPEYTRSEAVDRDTETIFNQGEALFKGKYREDTNALLNETQNFVDNLSSDPLVKRTADIFQRISKVLFYNKDGKLSFKRHLFDDFRYVLLPSLLDTFQFIPIPRIEYSDMKIDLMLDNMILTSTDLIPRLFEVHMNNSLRMVPRGNARNSADVNKHEFLMTINGLEANVRHVDYYVKTKEGFKIKDRGVADVLIHKRGMDIHVRGQKNQDEDDERSFITFDDVKVTIHSLSVKMRKTQHPILNIFAQPFINTAVKKAIAHSIEAEIREALISGDRKLATTLRDARIKSGKNTFSALVDCATSFVKNKVTSDDDKDSSKRKSSYSKTSRVIFDEDGLCVLDPVKHMELKVGQPLKEDKNAMASMGVSAPWVSTAFNTYDGKRILSNVDDRHARKDLPGMRRTQGTLAM